MDDTRFTSEQAQQQLAASQSRALRSARDRTLHAIGTAVFGLALGFFTVIWHTVSGTGGVVLAGAFAAVLLIEVFWVERAARTVPRRAGLWSRLGIGASLLVAMLLVLPWLNFRAQTASITWLVVITAALVVALPSMVAATIIARGRR